MPRIRNWGMRILALSLTTHILLNLSFYKTIDLTVPLEVHPVLKCSILGMEDPF